MAGLLFLILLTLLVIGIPVSCSLIVSGGLFLALTDLKPLIVVAQKQVVGTDSFVLLAIPLFILAGNLMEQGGISRRLVEWVQAFLGRFTGSMGLVCVVCSAIFAALTGSGPATVAAMGSILIPGMVESGYEKKDAAGLVAAAGALGPIIPPSVIMIVYATSMKVDVTKMFMGGILPGIFIAICLCITNFFFAKSHGIKGSDEPFHFGEFLRLTVRTFGLLLLPIIILGGIYGGLFSPTEAATVAVLYSLFLMIVYREFSWERLKVALVSTVESSASIVLIIGASNLFAWLISVTGLANAIAEAIIPIMKTQTTYLIFLTIFLFIVGCLMDALPSILILAPILVPVGVSLGCDEFHLAIVFCVNLIAGFVTPPFGCNLFTATTVSKLPYGKVVKGALPFMITLMVAVVIITFVPEIATCLPKLLGNG